jgi:hypothetical protein
MNQILHRRAFLAWTAMAGAMRTGLRPRTASHLGRALAHPPTILVCLRAVPLVPLRNGRCAATQGGRELGGSSPRPHPIRGYRPQCRRQWRGLRQQLARTRWDEDMRSLYRYIKSLGAPGKQAPTATGPDDAPKSQYFVLWPPLPAPACTRDLDCSVGQVCGDGPVRQCVTR